MTHAFQLESFDIASEDDSGIIAKHQESYDSGYAAGLLAAKENASALTDEFVQCLADLEFKYDEVRSEITQSLHPFLVALVETIFPQLAEKSFILQLSQLLTNAAIESSAIAFIIATNPDRTAAVAAALTSSSVNVTVSADPNLTPNAAWVRYANHEKLIDVDQLISEIGNILEAVEMPNTRNEANG